MEWSYWKVVCKYGHVKVKKEVSVARHLRLPSDATLLDAMDLAKNMPGVKHRGVFEAKRISYEEFVIGRQAEESNFYLIKLKSFAVAIA